jgi:hypothetical protein
MNIGVITKNILGLGFFLLLSSPTSAATLLFDPAMGAVGPGNDFALDILLEVEECVNAVEADISFPNDYAILKDFLVGDSIFSFWVKRPAKEDIAKANETGVLNFIGGVPGGYCGKITGDPGDSNTVARLIFQIPDIPLSDAYKSKLDFSFLPSSKALLNDGFGTSDNLTVKTASFAYGDKKIEIEDYWSGQIEGDTIPPEPFVVELRQGQAIFNGQYYIIFNTVDKQSGMDRYEILEIRPDEEAGVIRELSWLDKIMGKKPLIAEWRIANTPYLLFDQELLSVIRVKAIDKAGNERFVEYIPSGVGKSASGDIPIGRWFVYIGVFMVVAALLALLAILIKKIILNKKYDKEQDN